ncbi:uncharacterized protein SPPG_05689 [Spizellomyces punctatus DAOM BR117]|uniref:Chromatin-remodeling ATPase INO80 n=1 Tax=Spizellomyces punctatus (strain DAOM BR117) TaxID=645134 RepID=A0A0L0HEJ3_SPIPD|nr:uncharacterized protein SPPG_05689 [Spizellomyces punctatus DAOM BR117]KNC99451.1 hypothetical protein SPPG_05689 [Spizellomyces punctatus DAOM BR117]|eukprot:XP_016607491.1 hypothetical protein SPPG_05689 [Spizellomyces punctatus DAOM BR117]
MSGSQWPPDGDRPPQLPPLVRSSAPFQEHSVLSTDAHYPQRPPSVHDALSPTHEQSPHFVEHTRLRTRHEPPSHHRPSAPPPHLHHHHHHHRYHASDYRTYSPPPPSQSHQLPYLPELRYPTHPAQHPLHPSPTSETFSRRQWDAGPSQLPEGRGLYEGARYPLDSIRDSRHTDPYYDVPRRRGVLMEPDMPFERESPSEYMMNRRYSVEGDRQQSGDPPDTRIARDRYEELAPQHAVGRELRRAMERRLDHESRFPPEFRETLAYVRHSDAFDRHNELFDRDRSHPLFVSDGDRVRSLDVESSQNGRRRASSELSEGERYSRTASQAFRYMDETRENRGPRLEQPHEVTYARHRPWNSPQSPNGIKPALLVASGTSAAPSSTRADTQRAPGLEPMSISLLVNSSTTPVPSITSSRLPGVPTIESFHVSKEDALRDDKSTLANVASTEQLNGESKDYHQDSTGEYDTATSPGGITDRVLLAPRAVAASGDGRSDLSAESITEDFGQHSIQPTAVTHTKRQNSSYASQAVSGKMNGAALHLCQKPTTRKRGLPSEVLTPDRDYDPASSYSIDYAIKPSFWPESQRALEYEAELSSDPDDLDICAGQNMTSKAKKQLVRYMIRLRHRRRDILRKYEKKQKEKLAKFHKKLIAKYGVNLDRRSKTGKRKRLDLAQGLDEDRAMESSGKRAKQDTYTSHGDYYDQDVFEDPETTRLRELRNMEMARHHLWQMIAQRDIPRAHQIMVHYSTVKQQNLHKVAQLCRREAVRTKVNEKQQSRELTARAKRVAKEMLIFWKRNEKEERELRKKAEKEAMEQRKREEELREAQRQARKLNFLISQTELYSHFIGRKLGNAADFESSDPATEGIIEPVKSFGEIDFDAEDDEQLAARARNEAEQALAKQRQATRAFDESARARRAEVHGPGGLAISESTVDQMDFLNPSSLRSDSEIEQPTMLTVTLKSYQLKGLNWLANLYEQGINGILADEMGLGKTIQSIALMAYLAEKHDIWGPFLVVSPASTLPNWQQEIARFAPELKILPYWGDPEDRRTLRGFLSPKKLGVKDAPFHVAITSYQLIVTDIQQFNRIKWQYMILDEAQAIKSSSSQRWKTLLKMNSRNRLLLTGTPIQNSMQELWSLLHFIMPTLFDSHEEFSDWFSKDIESHVEDNGTLNEHQLRRLHMILKPFMLRRVKRDVENELADKIEVELSCQLTPRQKMLYQRLKQKISIKELMDKVTMDRPISSTAGEEEGSEDSLMNIVMQFRKVCNHPELFERADVISPFVCIDADGTGMGGGVSSRVDILEVPYGVKGCIRYRIPKKLYRSGLVARQPWKEGNIWHAASVWKGERDSRGEIFGFLHFIDTSIGEFSRLYASNVLRRWVLHILYHDRKRRMYGYLKRNEYRRPSRSMLNIVGYDDWRDGVHIEGLPNLVTLCEEEEMYGVLRRLNMAYLPAALAPPVLYECSDRSFAFEQDGLMHNRWMRTLLFGDSRTGLGCDTVDREAAEYVETNEGKGIMGSSGRKHGWEYVEVPAVGKLVTDSGKMVILDSLLPKLKVDGHRVLIFFQMTMMMDLMEEYLANRQYSYLRLDGSTSIFDRRDLVMDWQTKPELFIFLLSTRAGGLGINLTAADTVIFYDSDWNPTVDQQAMDRSHRLGQTKQVTVYRLITAGTIEERILMRARQKDQIQKVVISGGEFKQQVEFKPKEVLSLLLDDEEMEEKVRKESARRQAEEEEKERQKALKSKTPKSQVRRKDKKIREKEGAREATPAGDISAAGSETLSAAKPGATGKRKPKGGGEPRKMGKDVVSVPFPPSRTIGEQEVREVKDGEEGDIDVVSVV